MVPIYETKRSPVRCDHFILFIVNHWKLIVSYVGGEGSISGTGQFNFQFALIAFTIVIFTGQQRREQ